MESPSEVKMKILVLGESKVGKTCLINSYVSRTFNINQLSTIGLDFRTKKLTIDNTPINVTIYDTAGQERYRNLATGYMKSADGFLVCFDITSESSFQKVNYWIDSIKNIAKLNVKILIIGNKSDLEEEREVSIEQGELFASKHNTTYLETSSKEQTGVDKAFEVLINEILLQKKDETENPSNARKDSIQLEKGKTELPQKKNCC